MFDYKRNLKLNTLKLSILPFLIMTTVLIGVVFMSCVQNTQKVKYGTFPNTVVENATINDEYRDLAEILKKEAIDEFMNNICKIPRPSGHVEKIREYLYNWGVSNNFTTKIDTSGCVYMDVPASKGFEDYPNVIMQAHMDMVAANVDKSVDMTKTPIDLVYDEETGNIHSKDYKTSIGADDAQGIVAIMSIAKSDKVKHGPLRLLFTYDEETTMQGAKNLSPEILNADYIFNLDRSYAGTTVYSSSGSIKLSLEKNYKMAPVANRNLMTIEISGLKGGHSGIDIVKSRANAIMFERNILNALKQSSIDFDLVELSGGSSPNSIPEQSEMVLLIEPSSKEKIEEIVSECKQQLKTNFSGEEDVNVEIEVTENTNKLAFDKPSTNEILEVLNMFNDGIIEEDPDNKEVPISSNNLGVVSIKNGEVSLKDQIRSTKEEVLNELDAKLFALQNQKGFSYTVQNRYPTWPGSKDSKLIELICDAYKNVANLEAQKMAIHAGLECSFFHIKKPTAEIVCFGSDVEDEHAVTETFHTKSYAKHLAVLIYTLENINSINNK